MGWFNRKPRLTLENVVEAYLRAGVTTRFNGIDVSVRWIEEHSQGDIKLSGSKLEQEALKIVRVYEGLRKRAVEYPMVYNSNILSIMNAKLHNFLYQQSVAKKVAGKISGEHLENLRNRVMVKAFQNGLDTTPEFVQLVEATSVESISGIERALDYRISRQLTTV